MIGRAFREMLSRLASRLVKRDFSLDARLPIAYLISEVFRRAVMMAFGIWRFGRLGVLVSPSADIRCRSRITLRGNLIVDDNVVLNALSENGIELGRSVSIGKHACIECTGTISSLGKGLIVGDRVGIGSFSFLGCAGGIEIGDDTILGNFVSLHSENHIFSDLKVPIRSQGVTRIGIAIGKGCWIGAKATVLDGVTVGDNCVIAAGAVVLQGNYPDHVVLAGIPAKVVKVLA